MGAAIVVVGVDGCAPGLQERITSLIVLFLFSGSDVFKFRFLSGTQH